MKEKVIKIAEGFCFFIFLLAVLAMDSPDCTLPMIGTVVSLYGLVVMAREEQHIGGQ